MKTLGNEISIATSILLQKPEENKVRQPEKTKGGAKFVREHSERTQIYF